MRFARLGLSVALAFDLFWLALVCLGWVAALRGRMQPQGTWGEPWVYLVPFSLISLMPAREVYQLLFQSCQAIRVDDDGTCEFRGPLRTTRVPAAQIISVSSDTVSWGADVAIVRYQGGRVRIPQAFDGLQDFLGSLKALNPALAVDGFPPFPA